MKHFTLFTLLVLAGFGCSGAESGPVALPVPFSGTLTASSRVVVADGIPISDPSSLVAALKSQSEPGCISFEVFNSNGVLSGACDYCPSTDVTSTVLPEGRQDQYTLPATCRVCNLEDDLCDLNNPNDIESVSSNLECFDFPHNDPILDATIPVGSELRRGVCSGVITEGTRSFQSSVDAELMDGRFVASSRLENGQKIFDQMIKWNWILHRANDVSSGSLAGSGPILADLFEDGSLEGSVSTRIDGCVPRPEVPADVGEAECFIMSLPLFCEGQDPAVDIPCGRAVESNVQFNLGAAPESKSSTLTICKESSCVTSFNTIGFRSELPGITLPDILGSRVFSVSITEHDPILCRDLTGDFKSAACEGLNDDDEANIELDYRCANATGPTGFPVIDVVGSAYIISIPE